MNVNDEDPFFRSLTALKDMLFRSTADDKEDSTTITDAPDQQQFNDGAKEALLARIEQLETQLRDATQANENEKKLRHSLNQAFVQLTEHNTQVAEQLATSEASKDPLQLEIQQLKETIRKQQEEQQAKQQEWDAERKSLVDARETALKECDSWQARVISKERHAQELQDLCKMLKQEQAVSTQLAQEASLTHKQTMKEMEQVLASCRADRDGLEKELSSLKHKTGLKQSGLENLKQMLSGIPSPGNAEVEADRSATEGLRVKNELILAIEHFIGGLLMEDDVKEEHINLAKEKVCKCIDAILALAVNATKKRPPPQESDNTERPDEKRQALDTQALQESLI
ncbi:hypothetical protein MPSEU_000485700 [Mayamaea pseudoterrestris]|nr:hypothetical protein MPSEU_000485700 [Mayamaea pseudoterrestris]